MFWYSQSGGSTVVVGGRVVGPGVVVDGAVVGPLVVVVVVGGIVEVPGLASWGANSHNISRALNSTSSIAT